MTHITPRSRGWLTHLWRKAVTPDDWSRTGEPHPWWDRYSVDPMLSFPRFDLSESSYALFLMANRTPAWREVYTRILDKLLERHTTWWAAVDWLSQIGPDPRRAEYPDRYRGLIPKQLWGRYDVPGWTANGIEPWGLQADPIGADGMLFFRGFFNLMLGIHRAVSGEGTWNKPFRTAGLDDQTFEWTHSRIAEHLAHQWRARPEGPHCENTKIWPFCLSAAGLGMMLTDQVLGSKTHAVYPQWVEDIFMRRLMEFGANGEIKSAPLYFDPIAKCVHRQVPLANLGTAMYMSPQYREVALSLYEGAVSSVAFNKAYAPIYPLRKEQVRNYTMAYLLALEFGDLTTVKRMQRALGQRSEPRWFGDGEDEFGYFFNFGEAWPRGQESALLMVADFIGEGTWSATFNSVDSDRFNAPTVLGVDFPRLGVSEAFNDPDNAILTIGIYAASTTARGERTSFRVTKLPSAGDVKVLRDGQPYRGWQIVDETTIAIDSTIRQHRFEISTGYRPGIASPPADAMARQSMRKGAPMTAAGPHLTLRISDVVSAGRQLASGVSMCPGCSGGAM